MRRKFIEALTYPRMLMTSNMDLSECPMNRYFHSTAGTCNVCDQAVECRWLNRHDEFSVLLDQPMGTLVGALLFSVDFVDAHVSRNNHNSRRCACETCRWLRDARHLIWEYENRAADTYEA